MENWVENVLNYIIPGYQEVLEIFLTLSILNIEPPGCRSQDTLSLHNPFRCWRCQPKGKGKTSKEEREDTHWGIATLTEVSETFVCGRYAWPKVSATFVKWFLYSNVAITFGQGIPSFYKSSESSDYLVVDIVAWVLPPERSSRITLTGVLATSRYTSANLEVKRSSKWKSFHFTFEYVA